MRTYLAWGSVKAWSPNIAATSCIKASSFRGESKKVGPRHPTGAALMAAVSLPQHGRGRTAGNNLSFAPCWVSAWPRAASRQRSRGSYLSSHSPAPPGAFLFLLGTTSPGALGCTGQEQGQTAGPQGCRSGCCLQKATERKGEREKRQEMCAFHMLSTRFDILGLAERSHCFKYFSCLTPGH